MAARGMVVVCVWALVVSLSGCPQDPDPSTRLPNWLTLYSIDFESFESNTVAANAETFHGYPVLGKVEITDPEQRQEIMFAVREAMALHKGPLAACFWPRHGLRAEENGTIVDYLICFQCVQMKIFHGEAEPEPGTVPIAEKPQALFNSFLERAGVALAPKPGANDKSIQP